ncbi:MAG TPA: hypothetical protein DD979_17800 [Gammaproteobacteria bacterium]|jgi:nucleoside-diphosphate-sugar epimerase|nr:hypothetical protein [Gammaproteobacteria bacterium]
MSVSVAIVGCGQIGLPLGQRLVADGYRVRGSTTRESRLPLLDAAGIDGQLVHLDTMASDALDDFVRAEVVVITVPPNGQREAPDAYLQQLARCAESVARVGVQKVMFTSSTDVYPKTGDWVSESDAAVIAPRFSRTPLLTLERVLSEHADFKTTVLRFAGIFGPDYQTAQYVSGREFPGPDDPVNMVHQEDCVAVMQRLIARDVWGETFNVVADEHPSRAAFFECVCDAAALPHARFVEGESEYRIVSNRHVKETLDYHFQYPDPLSAFD